MSVESIVARTGRSRKTLSNWLAAAQLPPPSRIIGWTRVLVAARMLDDTTQSTEKIARELHFMSGTALRNMMRRYLGCGPDALRQRGSFEYALSAFLDVLTSKKGAYSRSPATLL
jgi:AraC-like DNA-binding protein